MVNTSINKKGVALFIVLATIFIVILLANIVLSIISSQSRLTHHQVSRIQAYYAAQAGVNYALEMIRKEDSNWIPPSPDDATSPPIIRKLCRSGCSAPPDVNEQNLPASIQSVLISIGGKGSAGIPNDSQTRRISATVNYTYQ